MGKRVVIDTDECIGCESCVELCSEVFAFNEAEEKAEVIMPEGGPEDCIEEAMDTCPVECIHWEQDQNLAGVRCESTSIDNKQRRTDRRQ